MWRCDGDCSSPFFTVTCHLSPVLGRVDIVDPALSTEQAYSRHKSQESVQLSSKPWHNWSACYPGSRQYLHNWSAFNPCEVAGKTEWAKMITARRYRVSSVSEKWTSWGERVLWNSISWDWPHSGFILHVKSMSAVCSRWFKLCILLSWHEHGFCLSGPLTAESRIEF